MDTWRDKHPEWEYRLWTDDNVPPLTNQSQFDAMPHFPGKADILRYELLHRFGGVYVDADSACVSPLTEDLLNNVGFAAHESEYARPGLIGNSVIGARAGCALMASMIEKIATLNGLAYTPALEVWKLTGPLMFTRAMGQGGHTGYRIYPSFWFYPEHCSGVRYTGTVDRCYARQFWGSTKAAIYAAYDPNASGA
jgi:inositol phosphorylceramide mannosyltransferase catalytic subunit